MQEEQSVENETTETVSKTAEMAAGKQLNQTSQDLAVVFTSAPSTGASAPLGDQAEAEKKVKKVAKAQRLVEQLTKLMTLSSSHMMMKLKLKKQLPKEGPKLLEK
eukprot:6491339-Amphidinium_carterae.5